MDPDKADALLKLLQDGFPQTGSPRPWPISVHRDCDGPLLTYQVTKFFRGRFELWVSEDCFQHDPVKIRAALDELEWIQELARHDRLLLTARADSVSPDAVGNSWDQSEDVGEEITHWSLCWEW